MIRKYNYLSLLVLVVIVIVSAIFYYARTNGIKDLPEILKDGRLSVLIESGEHGFTRDSMKVYGFQYEIIKAFSNSLGVELLVINEDNSNSGIIALKQGQCNVLVSLRPIISDTTLTVTSLFPILSTRLMLVQRVDSSGNKVINKQYELDKDTITLMLNSPYKPTINVLSEEVAAYITLNEVENVTLDDLIKQVNENKINYTISPEYLVTNLKSRYPAIDFSLPLSFEQDLSWIVNKQSKVLQDQLNKFLETYVDSPEFRLLYNQYFSDN